MVRWPGKVPPGSLQNGIITGLEWFPTFVAAAGDPNIIDELNLNASSPKPRHVKEPLATAKV